MSSRQSRNRLRLAKDIELVGEDAMVACQRCQSLGLSCKISTLSSKCGSCVRNGSRCVVDDSLGDLEGSARALLKVRKEQEDAENEMLVVIAKVLRLRKQRALLESRHKKVFEDGLRKVEEIEALEAGGPFLPDGSLELPVTSSEADLDPSLLDLPSPATLEREFFQLDGIAAGPSGSSSGW